MSNKYKLCYADYASIELRVVCVLSGDKHLQDIILSGRKIHDEVALAAFGSGYTTEQRVAAKSVVHGVNYGRTPHGIAEGLGISLKDAIELYNTYLSMVPGLAAWQREIETSVLRKQETLTTPFGRYRRFPLITRYNKEEVYKEALAFKPQSIASDINTLAAVKLSRLGYDVRLLIHDAVLFQIDAVVATTQVNSAKSIMEEVAQEEFMVHYPDFKMEFPVEAQVGNSWGDFDE